MTAEDPKAIGRRLLANVTPEARSLEALSIGLRASGQRLDATLSPILGSLGVRMILQRALSRATARHPFLREITVYEDGIDAASLFGQASERDHDQVRQAFGEVVDEFVGLLSQMLGKDLATELLREALGEEDHR
jgi:hypothetical protein